MSQALLRQAMEAQPKTGWPVPALAQDDHRGLFRWFASKPDARRLVRAACAALSATPEAGKK